MSSKDFLECNKVWPVFIKPLNQIKAFTGTQVLSKFDAECVLQDFEGQLLVQEVIDPILTEWRLYVNRGKIIGVKNYKGDHMMFPNPVVMQNVVNDALKALNNISFTLDFGVFQDYNEQRTFLIEPNDGWAIGNYGLEPEDYLRFCEDRWKQIIGK